MLKIIGSVLVLFASAGFAFQITWDLKRHLSFLYDVRRLLFDIANETAYSLAPMDEVLSVRVRSGNPSLEELCRNMGQKLAEKEGGEGSRVWADTVRSFRDRLCLNAAETEIFAGAGGAFFGKTIEENEKSLAHYVRRLDAAIAQAEEEQKEKQKVYRTASVMCGLMIVLLFL